MLAVDDPLPQRPDQMEETVVSTMVQPEGFEFPVALSVIWSFPLGDVIPISGHFINRRRVVVKRHGQTIRRYHEAEYRRALRGVCAAADRASRRPG
jgi:hypothetical protein